MALNVAERLAASRFGFLVIWPPEHVRRDANGLRQRYDPVSQRICEAHITLTQPLRRPLQEVERRRLASIAESREPFEVCYGPLNSFLPYPCIWYEIQPLATLAALRDALHSSGLFQGETSNAKPFVPHMTITEGFSGPKVDEELLVAMQAAASSGSFLCDCVALIVPDDEYHFSIRAEFELCG